MAQVAVTGGLALAGVSALNQYLERDRNAQMRRTKRRPLVTGDIVNGRGMMPSVVTVPAKNICSN